MRSRSRISKSRLTSDAVELRVGITTAAARRVDAGEGLEAAEPFARRPAQLESEGTVLLASSSGIEDAARDRGAAKAASSPPPGGGPARRGDSSRDGQVTLSERSRTRRDDDSRHSSGGERPAPEFDMRLRGPARRGADGLASAASSLTLIQERGPLQVVQLATGQLIAESQAGELSLTLAVPAGDYVVRRVDEDQILSKKITVEPMSSESIEERSLLPSDAVTIASKGLTAYAELPPQYEVAASGGLRTNDGENPGATVEAAFTWRLSRKIGWGCCACSYNVPGTVSYGAPLGRRRLRRSSFAPGAISTSSSTAPR